MTQAIQEQMKLSTGHAISLGCNPLDRHSSILCADTVISGDIATRNGIMGAGAVIVGTNMDRPLVTGTKWAKPSLS